MFLCLIKRSGRSLILGAGLGIMLALVAPCKTHVFADACGTVRVAGSSWMNGNGVDSHSNGAQQATGNDCAVPGFVTDLDATPPQYGDGWQCVELAQRLYNTRSWVSGLFKSIGRAADIYTNASLNDWSTIQDGSINLSSVYPGDMVVSKQYVYGHVMLVDKVNGTGGNGTIDIVDQNANDGTETITVTNGSMTLGTYYVFSGIVHSPQNNIQSGSYLVVRNGGTLSVKLGLFDSWKPPLASGAVSMKAGANRIGFVDGAGNLYAKENWDGGWMPQTNGASEYRLTSGMIAVRIGGGIYAKPGANGSFITQVASGATSIAAAGNRLAFTDGSGNLWAKEGLNGGWVGQTNGASQYVVTPQMIAVRIGGAIYAKSAVGDLFTTEVSSGAVSIAAGGNRLAFVDSSGTLWAKEGINGGWVAQTNSVNDYVLTPSLIVIRVGSVMYAKSNVNETFTSETAGATSIQAGGNRMAFIDGSGWLTAKEGVQGGWAVETQNVAEYALTSPQD